MPEPCWYFISSSYSMKKINSSFVEKAHLLVLWKEKYLQRPWSWFSQMCWSRRCSVCEEISLLGPLRKKRKRGWMGAGGWGILCCTGQTPQQSFQYTLNCWITLTYFYFFFCLICSLNYRSISTDRFKAANLTWLEAIGMKSAGKDQHPNIYCCLWDNIQRTLNYYFLHKQHSN